MKITKQRLKEIIKEEISTVRESDWYDDENETRADRKYADSQAGLGDLQSTDRFTGGTAKEQMLRSIEARKILDSMSKEELAAFSMNLDADTAAELRYLLGKRMYAKTQSVTSTGPWAPEKRDTELEEGDEMELDETATEADIVHLMNAEKISRSEARFKLGLPVRPRNPNQTRGASTKPNQGRYGGY